MSTTEIISLLTLFLGGGGVIVWVLSLTKEVRDQRKTKRERIIEEELVEEKGAGLLVTTSSEAIAVFKIALETAHDESKRLRKEREEDHREKEEMASEIRELKGKVKYLESEVRKLQGSLPGGD